MKSTWAFLPTACDYSSSVRDVHDTSLGSAKTPATLALAEPLGEYAARLVAWLLAAGVETVAEPAAFARTR